MFRRPGRLTRRASAVVLAVCLFSADAGTLKAQSWQTLQRSMSARGEDRLQVHVAYAAGNFDLRPGRPGALFSYTLRFDEDHFEPVVSFDSDSIALDLSMNRVSDGMRMESTDPGNVDLRLPLDIPVALLLELGAARGEIELGGLSLSDLDISLGAAEATVSFATPLKQSPEIAHFSVGAGELELVGLGNLSSAIIEVRAGVGRSVVDLSGSMLTDVVVDITMGLGEVELRVPRGVGIDMDNTGLLLQIDAPGLERRDGRWQTPGLADAERTIRVVLDGAVGRFRVVRIDAP